MNQPMNQPTNQPMNQPMNQGESAAAIRAAVAQRIRETMQRRGLSGAELARRLGVSQPTIHAWVNGAHGLRANAANALA